MQKFDPNSQKSGDITGAPLFTSDLDTHVFLFPKEQIERRIVWLTDQGIPIMKRDEFERTHPIKGRGFIAKLTDGTARGVLGTAFLIPYFFANAPIASLAAIAAGGVGAYALGYTGLQALSYGVVIAGGGLMAALAAGGIYNAFSEQECRMFTESAKDIQYNDYLIKLQQERGVPPKMYAAIMNNDPAVRSDFVDRLANARKTGIIDERRR